MTNTPIDQKHARDEPHVPQVVFACLRNGRRSVIGRVLTEHYADGPVIAASAGTQPYVPGVKYVDWPVDDPGGQDGATVRRVVAELDTRVRGLLVELVPDIELPPSVLVRE